VYKRQILYRTEKDSSKSGIFYLYKNGLYSPISTLQLEEMLIDFIPTEVDIPSPACLSHANQMEVVHHLQKRRYFYRNRFNPDGIINFLNGYYHIDTDKLEPHHMDIISTLQLPYSYDKKATCPHFLKALIRASDNNPNKIAVIQEFVGYCITRDTKYDKALFIIGAAGSGKSTILNGIEAMLGKENVSNISMEQMGQPRYAGNFIEKLANIDREIPRDISGYEEPLKKIISGEAITVDTKFIPSYNANPYCKVIFAANDMPRISDTSDGLFRRMLLIDFDNIVEQDNMDCDLRENVKKEGPGIFNWAVEGLKRLMANKKFTTCIEITNNIERLKTENNAVHYFISECYEITTKEHWVTTSSLYENYLIFCTEIGSQSKYKLTTFNKELRKTLGRAIEEGQKSCKGINRRVWFGITKKQNTERGAI